MWRHVAASQILATMPEAKVASPASAAAGASRPSVCCSDESSRRRLLYFSIDRSAMQVAADASVTGSEQELATSHAARSASLQTQRGQRASAAAGDLGERRRIDRAVASRLQEQSCESQLCFRFAKAKRGVGDPHAPFVAHVCRRCSRAAAATFPAVSLRPPAEGRHPSHTQLARGAGGSEKLVRIKLGWQRPIALADRRAA